MNEVVASGEREHRKFSPSQSERFFNCPGSAALIERTPARATSEYADEGNIAHAVLEAGLKNGCYKVSDAIRASAYKDHPVTKGFGNFHYSIQDALDHIWGIVEELDIMYGDVVMHVEGFIEVPSFSAPGEASGYCDVYISSAKGGILYVIDYKHGVGVVKAAEGNTQAKQYAAGVLYRPDAILHLCVTAIHTVVLVIIQPRAFHPDGDIRSYTTTPLEIADYLVEMDEAIERCLQPDAPLNPGLSWCQFCPARSACPALARSAVAAILNDASKDVSDLNKKALPDPKSLDIGRLAYILSMKPMINTWLNGVESHADELSRTGYDIPGFKRVLAQAKRRYHGVNPTTNQPMTIEELAVGLASLIGCPVDEVYKSRELLNITDMDDKIAAAFKARVGRGKKKQAAEDAAQMFAFFTLKESSGNTVLVPLDDKRPAINKAQQAFGGVSGLISPPTEKETP